MFGTLSLAAWIEQGLTSMSKRPVSRNTGLQGIKLRLNARAVLAVARFQVLPMCQCCLKTVAAVLLKLLAELGIVEHLFHQHLAVHTHPMRVDHTGVLLGFLYGIVQIVQYKFVLLGKFGIAAIGHDAF